MFLVGVLPEGEQEIAHGPLGRRLIDRDATLDHLESRRGHRDQPRRVAPARRVTVSAAGSWTTGTRRSGLHPVATARGAMVVTMALSF